MSAYGRMDPNPLDPNPNKPWKMFSSGGSHSRNYTNLQQMTDAASDETSCVTFFAYDSDEVLDGDSNVAFAQMNVLTELEDDIGEVALLGPYEGLINSSLWINSHWVKQINIFDQDENSELLLIPIWPRIEVISRKGVS